MCGAVSGVPAAPVFSVSKSLTRCARNGSAKVLLHVSHRAQALRAEKKLWVAVWPYRFLFSFWKTVHFHSFPLACAFVHTCLSLPSCWSGRHVPAQMPRRCINCSVRSGLCGNPLCATRGVPLLANTAAAGAAEGALHTLGSFPLQTGLCAETG